MQPPTVVIVGRPNVGKSSLFNALCGERVAIVEPTAGVTRDRISRVVERDGVRFELVDTGGMGMKEADELAADVEMQILIAIEQADLVLLVVDARDGFQPLDAEIAARLRHGGKEVLVVANKCDRPSEEAAAAEFYRLGFEQVYPVSAVHRRGVSELAAAIAGRLPERSGEPDAGEQPSEPMKLALVGRRNVGKSTLVNYLAREPRVLVSERPGTTRDAVDVRFQLGGLDFVAIDTAGLRRRKQVRDSIEFYSMARAHSSIRRADVVALMMEAPLEIGRLEKQLADQIITEHKPCVLTMNKMDLAAGIPQERFRSYVRDRMPGMAFAPLVFISAATGENVTALLETARRLHEQSAVRVPTGELNRALGEAVARRPPPSRPGRHCKVYYATQAAVRPPTIVLFVNDPAAIREDYTRYLANQFRSRFAFKSVPIKFVVRGR